MNSSFFLSLNDLRASSSSFSMSFFFLISSFSASMVNASVAIRNSSCSFFLLRKPMFFVALLLICESCDIAVLSASLYARRFLADLISLIIPILLPFSRSIPFFIWSSLLRGAAGVATASFTVFSAGLGFAVAALFVFAVLSSLSKSPSLIKLDYKHQVTCL
jgi:hypothetical protein